MEEQKISNAKLVGENTLKNEEIIQLNYEMSKVKLENFEMKSEIAKLKQKLNMKTGTAGTLKYLEKEIINHSDCGDLATLITAYERLLYTFINIK